MIATIWYNAIIEKKKTFDDVPRLLKDRVRELLIANGHEDLLEEPAP